MIIDKDKILFDALRKVLQDEQYAHIGQAFKVCSEDLQRTFPSLSQEQQDIVGAYVHTLADVYVAAMAITLEEKASVS